MGPWGLSTVLHACTHTLKDVFLTYKPARIQYMISNACKGGRYHNVLLMAVIMIIAGLVLYWWSFLF